MRINEYQWGKLSPLDKKVILWFLRYQHFKYRISPPKKFRPVLKWSGLHLIVTLYTLSLMPPPPELPLVAIPITWGASVSTTVILKHLLKI